MKLGVIPENLTERIALWFGIPPPEILESWIGNMASRAVMVATKLDIFETLAAGPLTAQEIVEKCGSHSVGPQTVLAWLPVSLSAMASDMAEFRLSTTTAMRRAVGCIGCLTIGARLISRICAISAVRCRYSPANP